MKKYILFSAAALALLSPAFAFAQEANVTGSGIDRDSAVRDAVRVAVEEVVGTFIDSRTLVDKAVVTLDEIYAKSQGFVRNIRVLEESRINDAYTVKAVVDVDTAPDAKLLEQLNAMMLLNDPRVAVIVNNDSDRLAAKFPRMLEGAMNQKLIDEGFHHVVNANLVINEHGAIIEDTKNADYLVLGRLNVYTKNVRLPVYQDITRVVQSDFDTGFLKTRAELDAKVIKTDTQEIIGTFRVEAGGMQNDWHGAENDAVLRIAEQAAREMKRVFSMKAADSTKFVRIIARAADPNEIDRLAEAVKSFGGVTNAFVRAYSGGKGTIEVDGSLSPQQLYRMLREKLPLFLEQLGDSTLEVSL